MGADEEKTIAPGKTTRAYRFCGFTGPIWEAPPPDGANPIRGRIAAGRTMEPRVIARNLSGTKVPQAVVRAAFRLRRPNPTAA